MMDNGRSSPLAEFRHVGFAYKDDHRVLENVSFSIEPGETVAVVGHTGAGKTTLTNLLLRFYEVQEGQVVFEGLARMLGVRNVHVMDPTLNPKAFEELVRNALDIPELSVIIARRDCLLAARAIREYEKCNEQDCITCN
jgi:ABC-type dipeptide/oligopeptide/nickel transport system ATPase subunit